MKIKTQESIREKLFEIWIINKLEVMKSDVMQYKLNNKDVIDIPIQNVRMLSIDLPPFPKIRNTAFLISILSANYGKFKKEFDRFCEESKKHSNDIFVVSKLIQDHFKARIRQLTQEHGLKDPLLLRDEVTLMEMASYKKQLGSCTDILNYVSGVLGNLKKGVPSSLPNSPVSFHSPKPRGLISTTTSPSNSSSPEKGLSSNQKEETDQLIILP